MDACDNYGRESSIEKVYHYNPYGEVVFESLSSGPVNNYTYSGKERDDKQKAYDFSARMYMPSYARFTTMDPLCEQDPGRSPYLYCAGNPVNLVDPDGKVPRIYIQSESISPKRFGKDLSNQNAGGREVQAISDPVVFLKDLLSKFHE